MQLQSVCCNSEYARTYLEILQEQIGKSVSPPISDNNFPTLTTVERLVKALFKQDEYESELSDKVKTMEFYHQTFKDVAEQESFSTQQETLREVKQLKAQRKKGAWTIVQQIAHSRSEANLRHFNTTDVIKAESESSQRRTQELHNEVIEQLRADQARLEALFKTKLERHETDLAIDIKKVLKKFLSSNGRIDPRTNDSRHIQVLRRSMLTIDSLATTTREEAWTFRCFRFGE